MPPKRRSILLLMHHWSGYLHDIQLGIAQYITHRPEWVWTRVLPVPENLHRIAGMRVDGVIAYIEPAYVNQLQALGAPVVDVSNWSEQAPFPRVVADDVAIGKMAAEHLLDLGLTNFGVIGPGGLFSDIRTRAFVDALRGAQHFISVFPDEQLYAGRAGPRPHLGVGSHLARWLYALPKPVGIFATFDSTAAEVLEACRALKISVPDQISVLGVDNDPLISRFTHPPLSSIAPNAEQIGFQAARLLDSLMAGKKPPDKPLLITPAAVVSRQSTNTLAVADPDVASAIRFIRDHVADGISVDDLLRHIPVNRRYLERRFREHVGRSPLQEIQLSRLNRAKELLANTDMPMSTVARLSGFPNQERFSGVFRKQVGMTPTHFRRRLRLNMT